VSPKIRKDPDDENTVHVKIRDQRTVDDFGRKVTGKRDLTITHVEDYGVLVKGAFDVGTAALGLLSVGYNPDAVAGWAYRPHMADQEPSEWPNGLAVGGTPAVAFYFDPGPA